jgi:hypothetical protein
MRALRLGAFGFHTESIAVTSFSPLFARYNQHSINRTRDLISWNISLDFQNGRVPSYIWGMIESGW